MDNNLKNRKEIISEVLNNLEVLKKDSALNQYAIDKNIEFFEATKSILKYMWWLILKAPKIDSNKLLEINDLLPKYDEIMHRKLMEMEKRKFPGLITPLVERISDIIFNFDRQVLVANLGCGGMEAERQIIQRLIDRKYNKKVVFVGVDQSPNVGELIRDNLKDFNKEIDFYEVDELNADKLSYLNNVSDKKYLILLCKNNIFNLDRYFSENYFDMVFHTLFVHHLSEDSKNSLGVIVQKIAKHVIEYDGYLSWMGMIPQTIIGWNNPVFLNAEIFSNLRFLKKLDVVKKYANKKILFTKIGYYLVDQK